MTKETLKRLKEMIESDKAVAKYCEYAARLWAKKQQQAEINSQDKDKCLEMTVKYTLQGAEATEMYKFMEEQIKTEEITEND